MEWVLGTEVKSLGFCGKCPYPLHHVLHTKAAAPSFGLMFWKTLKQWHFTLRLRGHLSLGKLSSLILGYYALDVVPDARAGRGNPCVTMCLAGHKSARLAAGGSLGGILQSQSVLTKLEGCADFYIQLRAQPWTAGKQLWPLVWPVVPVISSFQCHHCHHEAFIKCWSVALP